MDAIDLLSQLGEVDDELIEDVNNAKPIPAIIKRILPITGGLVAAAVLVITIFQTGLVYRIFPVSGNCPVPTSSMTPTGSGTAQASIMVHGEIYEWEKMYNQKINIEIPEEWLKYGDIVRVNGEEPQNDCEFVSDFEASGEIYINPENDTEIYLLLNTGWFSKRFVVFKKSN